MPSTRLQLLTKDQMLITFTECLHDISVNPALEERYLHHLKSFHQM